MSAPVLDLPSEEMRTATGLNGQIVCVLGMHRSGTSLVSRISNILGLELGPEKRHREALPDNPKGFWEYLPFLHINNRILRRHGGRWDAPPSLPEGWEHSRVLTDLRLRARGAIMRDFRRSSLWGWKDPRTCLTAPFWIDLLPQLRTIVCIRNPVDVARSLERRNHFSFDAGIALWRNYSAALLVQAELQESVVIAYDELLAEPDEGYRRIACMLGDGAEERLSRTDVADRLGALIDPGLCHSRTSFRSLNARSDLPEEVKTLYRRLVDLSA